MGERFKLGKLGENAAVRYLKQNGYQVIERNYRCKYGEIDIIAKDGDSLVFVEVKSRTSSRYGTPYESVDWRKQRKIRRLAAIYLQSRGRYMGQCRFDVVGVQLTITGEVVDVSIIKNAF